MKKKSDLTRNMISLTVSLASELHIVVYPKERPVDPKGRKVTAIFHHIWYTIMAEVFFLHLANLPAHC